MNPIYQSILSDKIGIFKPKKMPPLPIPDEMKLSISEISLTKRKPFVPSNKYQVLNRKKNLFTMGAHAYLPNSLSKIKVRSVSTVNLMEAH